MNMISALTFDDRRFRSSDIPLASPVKSMMRVTPSATPATLTKVRIGLWRIFAVIKLSTDKSNLLTVEIKFRHHLLAAITIRHPKRS
jgi:hypothetical protein